MRTRLSPILAAALAALAVLPATADAGLRRAEAKRVLKRAEAVRAGHGVKTGFELTPLLKELSARLRDLPPGHRRRGRRLLERPTTGDGQPGEVEYRVPEHVPLCSLHFCVHWVSTTADAPPPKDTNGDGVPDFVATVSDTMEHVHDVENGSMGWREPVGDATRGGDVDKTDVYLEQLNDQHQGIYGYSTPDPNQKGNAQFAYMVLDNDFAPSEFPGYPSPVEPMEVTAAHEYSHVTQFGYDAIQDIWMFESTAVWMEDKVYDGIDDYLSYLPPWARLTRTPLTAFDLIDPSNPTNVKVYGDAVWNRWIEAHYGQDAVRLAWEKSLATTPRSFAPGAYDAALRAHGTSFLSAFTRFAADTAEWRSSASPFEEGSTWPDIPRSRTAALNSPFIVQLDHTAYTLVNVPPTGDARIRLVGTLPAGTAGGVAFVGRSGSPGGGALEVEIKRVPAGGRARVELANPSRFTRITAVIVNAAIAQDGYDASLSDWDFSRVDAQRVGALVSNDLTPPELLSRTPAPDKQNASRSVKPTAVFSERVTNVNAQTMRLVDSAGHRVDAAVSYDPSTHTARLAPHARLAKHARYEVRLGVGIVDRGQNPLPAAERTWRFRTGA